MKEEGKINQIILLITIFFIGAFIGFIYEVIFYKFTEGVFANRGSLYGPCLPIYGTGAVLIYYLKPLKKHPILLFLSIMLVTGLLEYIVGIYILKFQGLRLWDYRGLFMNIQGLVCLRSVLTFAVGGMTLIYEIEPYLLKILPQIKLTTRVKICTWLIIIFLIDVIVSTLFRTPITY